MCDLSDIPFVLYSLTVHQFFLSMILGISFFLEWAWLCCKIVIAIINRFFLKFTEIKIDIKIIYNSYMTFDNQILTLFCHLWAMILQLLCLSLSALLFSFDIVLICLFVVLVAIKIKNILYFYLVYVVNKIKEERCCKEGKFKNLLIHSFNPSRTYLNLTVGNIAILKHWKRNICKFNKFTKLRINSCSIILTARFIAWQNQRSLTNLVVTNISSRVV